MTEEVEGNADPVSRRSISGFVLVPLIAFALMVLFGWGLFRGGDDLPSALLGKPVPDFALPPVLGADEASAVTSARRTASEQCIARWTAASGH